MSSRTKRFIEEVKRHKCGGIIIRYKTEDRIMYTLECNNERWTLVVKNIATNEKKVYKLSIRIAVAILDRHFKLAV